MFNENLNTGAFRGKSKEECCIKKNLEIEAQGSSAILEELSNIHDALDAIAGKVEPAPAPVPNHFKLATLYATPFFKVREDIEREAAHFDGILSGAWARIYSAATSPTATKNVECWEKAVEVLSQSWYQQISALRSQIKAVCDYAEYMTVAVATACECDPETLGKASIENAEKGAW